MSLLRFNQIGCAAQQTASNTAQSSSIEFTKSTAPYHHWTVPSSGANSGFPLVVSNGGYLSSHTGSYNIRYITVPNNMSNVRIYLAAQTNNWNPPIQTYQQDWTYAGVEIYRPSTSSVIQTYNFSEHFNTQSTSTTSGWTTTTTLNRAANYTIGPPETVAQVSAKAFSPITTSGNYAFRMATSTTSTGTGMANGLASNANISGIGNVISGVLGRYYAYIETSGSYLLYYSTVYMRSPVINLVAGDRIYVAAQLPTSSTSPPYNDGVLWIGVT